MRRDFVFTSESVTEGHPDKLCDQISDAIVDRFLRRDPYSSVVSEAAVSQGVVFIAARFATEARVDIPEVTREVIREVGYTNGPFNANDCAVLTSLAELPPATALRIPDEEMTAATLDEVIARHQATVFGYACRQTPELMPLPVSLAHRLARRLSEIRVQGEVDFLCPDGKTQVGVQYRDGQPTRIHSITLLASQRRADRPDPETLHSELTARVIDPVFAVEKIGPDDQTRIFVNPDGPLVGGGPALHAGLTGRKNHVDTYGEYARHSGAALSGKGPLRIDRVGAYAARYAAKNVVAAGLAEECEVALSYTIGLALPVSVQVETFGTGSIPEEGIRELIREHFEFRLGGIVRDFRLRHLPEEHQGFFRNLAVYGQMGRADLDPPWEALDHVEALRGH
jgi:S-adenosylmethionine synthetase